LIIRFVLSPVFHVTPRNPVDINIGMYAFEVLSGILCKAEISENIEKAHATLRIIRPALKR
jgi:hypothetical protein